jgi:hypothetical protein
LVDGGEGQFVQVSSCEKATVWLKHNIIGSRSR